MARIRRSYKEQKAQIRKQKREQPPDVVKLTATKPQPPRRREMITTDIAETIARALRTFGYPSVTARDVIEQVNKPKHERNIIGKMAVSQLIDAGMLSEEE